MNALVRASCGFTGMSFAFPCSTIVPWSPATDCPSIITSPDEAPASPPPAAIMWSCRTRELRSASVCHAHRIERDIPSRFLCSGTLGKGPSVACLSAFPSGKIAAMLLREWNCAHRQSAMRSQRQTKALSQQWPHKDRRWNEDAGSIGRIFPRMLLHSSHAYRPEWRRALHDPSSTIAAPSDVQPMPREIGV